MEDAWQRVAAKAAEMFLERGYAATSLRVLASALGIRAASLYHHCPGGKPELYERSLTTHLEAYRVGLEGARAGVEFPADVEGMARYLAEHPLVDMQRIFQVDLPALNDEAATERLLHCVHAAVHAPFAAALRAAKAAGHIRDDVDPDIAAAAVVALVGGMAALHPGAELPLAGLSLLLAGTR
jgi:AcrR family transcriptional regulator